MFSKSQVNHKTIWRKIDMNDNQLNNKLVIRTCTQQYQILVIQDPVVKFHMLMIFPLDFESNLGKSYVF